MTLGEIISRARALRTMHLDTRPPEGPQRDAWLREQEALRQLIRDLTTRLNESREVRA